MISDWSGWLGWLGWLGWFPTVLIEGGLELASEGWWPDVCVAESVVGQHI